MNRFIFSMLLSFTFVTSMYAMEENASSAINYSRFSEAEMQEYWTELVAEYALLIGTKTLENISQNEGRAMHYLFDQKTADSPLAGKILYRLLARMESEGMLKRQGIKSILLPCVGIISHEARAISQFFGNPKIIGFDIDEVAIKKNQLTFKDNDAYSFKVADGTEATIWDESKDEIDLVLIIHPEFTDVLADQNRVANLISINFAEQLRKLKGKKVVMIFTSALEATTVGTAFSRILAAEIAKPQRLEIDDLSYQIPCLGALIATKGLFGSESIASYASFTNTYNEKYDMCLKNIIEMRYRSVISFDLSFSCNSCSKHCVKSCKGCPVNARYCDAKCQALDWPSHKWRHKK